MKFLALILFFIMTASAQDQPYQPNNEIDSLKLSDQIFLLRSNGKVGNPNAIAFVGADGVFLVDSSFASFGEKLKAKLKEFGSSEIKFIVNTHWHGDHTGGNENFGSATILARTNTRKRLLTQGLLEDNQRLLGKSGLPDLLFDAPLTFFFNDEEIKIIPMQGHTDGDSIVYFSKAKVLCVGDYFFLNRFPVIDVEESGADLESYLQNIKFITENFADDVKIVPGHSDFLPKELRSATMQDLKNYYAILLESIEFIRQKFEAKKSLEEIQKESLPKKFQSFGARPRFVSVEKWIETVYQSLNLRIKK